MRKMINVNYFVKLNRALLILFILAAALTTQAQEYTWGQLTIGGGGYVTGVVVHPTEPNLVYCRTDVGGAYKYNFSTLKWEQLLVASAMPSEIMNLSHGGAGVERHKVYYVESIAIDPSNPDVVFIGSGEALYDGGPDGALLKSTDRGESFTLTNLAVQMNGGTQGRTYGERMVVDPNNSNMVYYGSRQEGLQKSTDGGINWSQIATSKIPLGGKINGTSVGVTSVVFDDQSSLDWWKN